MRLFISLNFLIKELRKLRRNSTNKKTRRKFNENTKRKFVNFDGGSVVHCKMFGIMWNIKRQTYASMKSTFENKKKLTHTQQPYEIMFYHRNVEIEYSDGYLNIDEVNVTAITTISRTYASLIYLNSTHYANATAQSTTVVVLCFRSECAQRTPNKKSSSYSNQWMNYLNYQDFFFPFFSTFCVDSNSENGNVWKLYYFFLPNFIRFGLMWRFFCWSVFMRCRRNWLKTPANELNYEGNFHINKSESA